MSEAIADSYSVLLAVLSSCDIQLAIQFPPFRTDPSYHCIAMRVRAMGAENSTDTYETPVANTISHDCHARYHQLLSTKDA